MVMGSLGINGWFEYGGKNWTKKDFEKKIMGYCSDSHCWFEDDEGNVSDYLYEDYDFWVKFNTRQKMRRVGLVEGVSKEELARDGVEYVPAPKDAQTALFLATFKFMRDSHDGLLKGTCKWNGTHLQQEFNSLGEIMAAMKKGGQFVGFV